MLTQTLAGLVLPGAFGEDACWCLEQKETSHVEVKLIGPVPDHFVLRCSVPELVLVDLVATRGVSVFIEEHWVAGNTWIKEHCNAVSIIYVYHTQKVYVYQNCDSNC